MLYLNINLIKWSSGTDLAGFAEAGHSFLSANRRINANGRWTRESDKLQIALLL